MFIIEFIKTNYLLVLGLAGVGILYFLLDKIFGKKKEKPDEEDEEETIELKEPVVENKHKVTKGYSEHTSSYMSEARHYDFIPKNGGGVRVNDYNKKKTIKNTKKDKDELVLKEQIYSNIFYIKRIENLSIAAKEAKLSNEELLNDLKIFKKNGKFMDVDIDFINDKIIYANTILDRNEEVFYSESEEEKIQTHSNGIKTHKCPYCGTDNIVDDKTKMYNCYYCLKEVKI